MSLGCSSSLVVSDPWFPLEHDLSMLSVPYTLHPSMCCVVCVWDLCLCVDTCGGPGEMQSMFLNHSPLHSLFTFNAHVWVFFLHGCLCITYIRATDVRKGCWISRDWSCELPCAGDLTQILCKSSQCAWPLSHLSVALPPLCSEPGSHGNWSSGWLISCRDLLASTPLLHHARLQAHTTVPEFFP